MIAIKQYLRVFKFVFMYISGKKKHFLILRRNRLIANILKPLYTLYTKISFKFLSELLQWQYLYKFFSLYADMLEQTFKALHFSVVLYKWLCVDEILSALTEALKRRENRDGDGFICCIISRGTENHLLGTDLYAVGLKLDRLKRLFTAAACPALVGKPKLFFIQRYSIPESQPFARREHRDEDLETDGCKEKTKYDVIPEDADVFWSHCWTEEHQLEQGQHNSVYLKALKDALHKGQMR